MIRGERAFRVGFLLVVWAISLTAGILALVVVAGAK